MIASREHRHDPMKDSAPLLWLLACLGIVGAVVLAIASRYRKRITAPLADVLRAVERLSSGDWATHVKVPQGRIGRTLGSALERLRINLSDHAATGAKLRCQGSGCTPAPRRV